MRIHELPTPCYVIDEKRLRENLEILRQIREETGCRILLAQKAFSCFDEYPLIADYLDGTTASGLFEARLGKEEMGKENHVFAPAYRDEDIEELSGLCDHIIFNSFSQLRRHAGRCRGRSLGLRLNPEHSTQGDHAIYDPCAPGSRLGVTARAFRQAAEEEPALLSLLEGFHFHTLCEQNSDDLASTLAVVEERFGPWLSQMKWLNMGGGHHITRPDYDRKLLCRCIRHVQETYGLTVYLEPGEAVALNAGYLATTVMDITDNGIQTLILDASAACHMPDVLEMPYRPPLKDSGMPGEKAVTCRLSSCTCLAGDVIGDYSFDRLPAVGDRLYFEDMAIYSMVKNNTFNGIPLPGIARMRENGDCEMLREFGYADFKDRLGSGIQAGSRFSQAGSDTGYTMPGEYEPHHGTLMIWPERPGSWAYGAVPARKAFAAVAEAIADSEEVYMLAGPGSIDSARASLSSRIHILPIESDDAWARDVGPTFVRDRSGKVRGIDWQFNAWGGAVDGLYASWERDDLVASRFCRCLGYDCQDARDLVLEGGSVHSDGQGTLLVTEACLLSPGRNPQLTKAEIEARLKHELGAEKVIWLPHGIYQDETNEHVDNICAFVRPGEVVLAWTDDKDDPQYAMSAANLALLEQETDARGRSLRIHKLPVPKKPVCITAGELAGLTFEEGEDTREPGERLAASYVNFYLSNGGVIVPQFGDEQDETALAILGGLFPDRTLYPVYARDIITGGGNIHCITQQIPAGRKR